MATTQRDSKGSPLTFTEVDANWDIVDTVVTGLAAHLADTVDAHDASAISNVAAGNIVATTVQAAIDELDGQDTTIQTNLNTRTGTTNSTGFRNRLHNGSFNVAQRGTGFTSATVFPNNDAVILLDRWRLLSDGNDAVDVNQDTTTLPTQPDSSTAINLDVETINKKFGIIQWIERQNCYDLIGGNVIVSFKAKCSGVTKLDNIKCAIIAWSSTADAPTADAISAWGVEGTNPTLVANMTYENTPANLGVTASYATYSVTALVDTASTANIGVFIWSDVTDTTLGEFVYITDVQLEAGTVVTPYDRKPIKVEEDDCARYIAAYRSGNTTSGIGWGIATGATTATLYWSLPVRLRTIPTGVTASSVTHFQITSPSFASNIETTVIVVGTYLSPWMVGVNATVGAGLTTDSPSFLSGKSANAVLVFTGAEI